jgi:NAD(P)-dependent dehydrogenase (short-subunit alcohol dehydrogenase family)
VIRRDIYAGPLQIVVDDSAQHRGCVRDADECFAHELLRKAALATTVPMGRLDLSEELANAIIFIASNEASFITGHILNVDGGKTH